MVKYDSAVYFLPSRVHIYERKKKVFEPRSDVYCVIKKLFFSRIEYTSATQRVVLRFYKAHYTLSEIFHFYYIIIPPSHPLFTLIRTTLTPFSALSPLRNIYKSSSSSFFFFSFCIPLCTTFSHQPITAPTPRTVPPRKKLRKRAALPEK